MLLSGYMHVFIALLIEFLASGFCGGSSIFRVLPIGGRSCFQTVSFFLSFFLGLRLYVLENPAR